MSRDIKFRAWDNEKKLWVSNGEIEFSISEGSMVVCPNTIEHIGDSVHDYYIAERFSVQQYTGLKDKNGVEIYEGDIVRRLETDWPSQSIDDKRPLDEYLREIASIGEVIWLRDSWYVGFCGSMNPGAHGYIEVIGNIYEKLKVIKGGQLNETNVFLPTRI